MRSEAEVQAGRELDEIIGDRIFGLRQGARTQPYSTWMAAAWLVVDHLKDKRGFELQYDSEHIWNAYVGDASGRFRHRGRAETPALAICLAALRAVEVPT